MANSLHVLLLEADAAAAELITHELQGGGFAFDVTRIHSEPELRNELEGEVTNLVLADHDSPELDAFKALEIVRAVRPELPFIFLSRSNDQGLVARMSEAGATDYVFKRDVQDLNPAVRRAFAVSPPEPQAALPPTSAANPIGLRRLHFCPICSEARDEFGALVDFWRCFHECTEIVVLCARCHKCDAPVAAG